MQRRGFILTGGRSSRLGQDKALLPVSGGTLAEHLAGIVARTAGSATLVGPPARYAHLSIPCVPDLRPGLGPLSGIEAALLQTETDHNLILACDLPGIDDSLLNSLFSKAESSVADCVCVRDAAGMIHPLCAVYRRSCLGPVQAALDSGKLRLLSLLDAIDTVYVDTNQPLANINTLAEWNSFAAR
jgi:molybdopterin-guanine dinucleotide biosynthesis protein A